MLYEVITDLKIRKMVQNLPECKNADIAEIEIVRHPQRVTIVIHTARPGVIIGVKGANIEQIGIQIQKSFTKKVQIKIKEIKRSEINASLVSRCQGAQVQPRLDLGGAGFPLVQLGPIRVVEPAADGSWLDRAGPVVLSPAH